MVSKTVTPAPLPGARSDNSFLYEQAGCPTRRQRVGQRPGSAGQKLTAVRVGFPAHGAAFIDPDGTFAYRPKGGFVGLDSFGYQALAADGRR
ncbi:MAG TPA: Ig-like domain-containing protein [Microlunatus sp.]